MLSQLSARTAKTRAIPSLHRDNQLAKVTGFCPDAASGNCPARQAGSFAGTAHRAVPKRSALHIAGPLGVRVRRKTIVSLYEKNLLYMINFSHFAGILPSGQLYRDRTTSTHLEGLMHSAA